VAQGLPCCPAAVSLALLGLTMASLRFSTSVLEQQRTLGTSNVGNASQDAAPGEQSPKAPGPVRKLRSPVRHRTHGSGGHLANEGGTLEPQERQSPSNKENQLQPEDAKAPPPKRSPSAGAFWTQMREADQLRQRLAQEEKLRLQAEAQLEESRSAKRSRADAQARELEELRSEVEQAKAAKAALAKPPVKKVEAWAQTAAPADEREVVKAEVSPPRGQVSSVCPEIIDGFQKGMEDMEAQLGHLGRQTARNEAYLKKLHARYQRGKSRTGTSQVSSSSSSSTAGTTQSISSRMLAMRVVHGAVVSSLLSESEQDHPGQSEHEDGNEGITADEPKMNLQDVDISCISVQPSYPDEDSLKHRLGELKVQWAEAEARCAEMQASLAQQGEMSCRRVELKIQVAATEQRCKEMQSALSAAEARFAEMQSSSDAEDDFKRHRDEIKTRLAAAEQRCKEMQSALTGAEARFAEMESETAEDVLKRQLSELKIQWAATEARCAEMQTSVTQQDELRSQRDSLKAQLASAEAKCAGLSESQDELRSQRDSLKAQLASAEAKCAGLSESQEASRKTCERLQAELDRARDDESKVQAEFGSVKRELDEAKVELAATRAQCATIAATMSQPSQPCDTDFAKQPAEDRDFEVRRMQEEFDRKEACLQAELARKEEQICSLEATRERTEAPHAQEDSVPAADSVAAASAAKSDHEAVLAEEDLLAQNNQLVLSLQLLKQDCDLLEAENRNLKDTAAMFEQNFDRVAGQHARLMGHANHKQKIHHTLRLKEDNLQLRSELTRVRKRLLQLEASRRGESLVDALAPLSAAVHPVDAPEARACTPKNGDRSCTPKNAPVRSYTPKQGAARASQVRRSASSAALGQSSAAGESDPFFVGSATGSNTASRGTSDAAEQRRLHCCNHERTLERISVDFRHFTALIERAVAASDLGTERDEGADLASLLQRLRSVVVKSAPGDEEW